jgi:hypothetical protein
MLKKLQIKETSLQMPAPILRNSSTRVFPRCRPSLYSYIASKHHRCHAENLVVAFILVMMFDMTSYVEDHRTAPKRLLSLHIVSITEIWRSHSLLEMIRLPTCPVYGVKKRHKSLEIMQLGTPYSQLKQKRPEKWWSKVSQVIMLEITRLVDRGEVGLTVVCTSVEREEV